MTDVRNQTSRIKNKKKMAGWEMAMTAPLIILLFRIPLANILGNEGNGYLALSCELFILFTMLFGYGISETIYEIVRKRVQKNLYHNSIRILTAGLVVSLLISGLGAVLIYFLSDYIFQSFYGIKAGSISFRIFSAYLPVTTLSGCLRGFFEGIGSKVPTNYSKIVEAVIAGVGALFLASMFSNYGDKVAKLLFYPSYKPGYGAAGVVLALFIGGISGLLLLIIIYKVYQISFRELLKKDDTRVFESIGLSVKEILYTLLVITLPVLFLKIYRSVNIALYINSLEGEKKLTGIRYLGTYYGKVVLLVFLCVTLILGFYLTGIGRIKKACLQQKHRLVQRYYKEDMKELFIISSVAVLMLMLTGKYLMEFLFKGAVQYEIRMLQIGALGVLLSALSTYNFYILSALNRKAQILVIYIVSFVIQTAGMLVILKTPIAGYAVVIAELIFGAVASLLQILYISKSLGFFNKDE